MSIAITVGGVPTLGSLVGTSGSDALIRTINAELNNSDFFGSINDIMIKGRQAFVQNFVEPIRGIGNTIKNAVGIVNYDEKYIAITSEDLLMNIPTCMHLPILQYQPVRKLFDEGRIFGFGHQAIPDGDPYGRLINNGTVDNLLEALDDEDHVNFEWTWKSTDPDLSFDELNSIEETRNYLQKLIDDSDIDFTDAPNLRG